MTDDFDPPILGSQRGLIVAVIVAVVIGLVVALVHGPSVSLALTGDSYQWIQHAHAAAHNPALLVADLDTFLRPSNTWTLVLDRVLWGGFNARGYRTTSLLLHGLVAVALFMAGRRLGLGPVAAPIVALLWVTSAFTDESAFVVAYRFQPLLLLAWLALIALWPRQDQSWSAGRMACVVAAILAAAAAKETWVVTPALVFAMEVDRRRSIRASAIPTVVVGAAVACYMAVYFLAFPTSKSYYAFGEHVFARIPQQLAAFLFLDESNPFSITLSWPGLLALAVVAAVSVACVRWRVPGTWVALFLLVLPTLPTLPVTYMPQRYLAIPYAGFLLLAALWIGALVARMPRWQRPIRGFSLALASLVAVAGVAMVRADLKDYRAMADAHAVLLAETLPATPAVGEGSPVVVVRDEEAQPLAEILRNPHGLPKLPFTRHQDPYGLVDTAALFEWTLAEEGRRVERIDDQVEAVHEVKGTVILHRQGEFVNLGQVSDWAAEADRWQLRGRHVRVVLAVHLH
jgi:hypothetical protein